MPRLYLAPSLPVAVADSNLLTVRQAADLLGVHVDTIRRWTDEGRLPETRTPGGHRRIPREAAEALREAERKGTPRAPLAAGLPATDNPADRAWAQHAVVHTRYELSAHPEVWTGALSDEDRQQSRENGRRLMGLLLQYVAGSADEDGLWPEVGRLTRNYARKLKARGVPYADALRATHFFRDVLSESTAYYPHLHEQPVADQVALVRKVNRFTNEVQLAIADAYDRKP
ncbi:MAG: helix-turn-helix domain-containing protein [Bacteroidota bacterium]